MEERIYTTEELAAMLRVSVTSICRWARAGKIPGFRVGYDWRFTESQIQEFIKAGGTAAVKKGERLPDPDQLDGNR